ncbi:sugar ABC transporter substrate-binding protein [Streptomyces mirabilis]|uniref:sugar ABC transporter substrate-binding protein n=1 Tax=Streptomyces mirabilis TaxID=68239 RepID=UPI00369C9D7B
MRPVGFRLRVLPLLALASCLAACTTTATTTATTSADSQSAPWLKEIKNNVQAQYKGKHLDLVTSGPKAVKNADVWYVSCGEAVSGCASAGAGFKQAASALKWKLTYVDGKFDPNTVSAGIEQAVAAGAKAIGINVFDCAAIKTALQKAKAAGVPVVSTWSTDCSPSLITAITSFAGTNPKRGLTDYSTDKINWAVAATGGKAKVIDVYETDLQSTIAQETGYRQGMTACPTCSTVETVKVTVNGLPNLQALVSAALTKHPEANVVNIPYGGLLAAGVQAAVTQSGRVGSLQVVGGACDGGEQALMAKGWNIACGGYEQAQTGWMTADYINRLLSGTPASDLPKVGIGYQLVDRDHRQKSDTFTLPADFRAAYTKVWTGS